MNKETFLEYMKFNHRGNNPLHRTLMSNDEIKMAETLVKNNQLVKGHAIENGNRVIYYYDK